MFLDTWVETRAKRLQFLQTNSKELLPEAIQLYKGDIRQYIAKREMVLREGMHWGTDTTLLPDNLQCDDLNAGIGQLLAYLNDEAVLQELQNHPGPDQNSTLV